MSRKDKRTDVRRHETAGGNTPHGNAGDGGDGGVTGSVVISSRNENADKIDRASSAVVGHAAGEGFIIPFDNWRMVALLSLISAALMALAFSPPGWSWMAHLALAPMLLAIVRSPSRWSVILGTALAGAAFFGGEMYWLVATKLPSFIGTVLYCLLFWVGFGLLLRMTVRRTRLPLTLLAPVWWVTMEIGRSYLLTGFPWLLLGHAQARTLVLLQSADIAGPYLLSAISAATAGLLVDLITRPVFLRYGRRIRFSRSLKYAAAGLAIAWAVTIGYGFYRLRPVEMSDGPQVITVQCNVPQKIMDMHAGGDDSPAESSDGEGGAGEQAEEKEKSGQMLAYEQLYEQTRLALEEHPEADLVVWPETMVPGYLNWEILRPHLPRERLYPLVRSWRDYWKQMHGLIENRRTSLLFGSQAMILSTKIGGKPDMYNSAILMRPNDSDYFSRVRYDKVHLVPFGEIVPFRDSVPWLYNLLMIFTPYDSDYNVTAGESLVRMEAGGGRFAAPICFESAIARVCRRMVYDGEEKKVDFLANISNDGWFHDTIELRQHWDQSVFRAVENRVPVVRSVNTGISGFIDSNGRTVDQVRVGVTVQSVVGYAAWRLKLDPRKTFYGRFGDVFGFAFCIMAAASLVMAVAAGRRRSLQAAADAEK